MCLAFPGKVVEVVGDFAKIDFGGGTTRSDINISHTDAVKDDYVLVHAGYAIQVLDLVEATNVLAYWQDHTQWKCERCDISEECPTGMLVKEIVNLSHKQSKGDAISVGEIKNIGIRGF